MEQTVTIETASLIGPYLMFEGNQPTKDLIFGKMMSLYSLTPIQEFVLRRYLSQSIPPELRERFAWIPDRPYYAALRAVIGKIPPIITRSS